MKRLSLMMLSAALTCIQAASFAGNHRLMSPHGNYKVVVSDKDSISLTVLYRGKKVLDNSTIELEVEGRESYRGNLRENGRRSVRNTINPLYGKNNKLDDSYNEMTLAMAEGFSLTFRAYDDGVAYRFSLLSDEPSVIQNEKAVFRPDPDSGILFPETDNFTSWELTYHHYDSMSAIPDGKRSIVPMLMKRNRDGVSVVIAESDVRDYPGMYLEKYGDGFHSRFAAYPDRVEMGSWGNFVSVVKSRKDHIAECSSARDLPWRIIIATDDDRTLPVNELVYKLAAPQADMDFSWVRPGKAAWEWWHDAILPGEELPSGMKNRNTALYKRYIDFAAENGLEYLLVDAGWTNLYRMEEVNPKFDVEEIVSYASGRGIGVFLWCTAHTLHERLDFYLDMFERWGVSGLKVDFFDRDDQLAMRWYEDIAREAAKHHLMVNFHGCSKPTGLNRMYPNVVTYEAVRGAECSKWDFTANPEHHLTIPFVRMLCGSLDYTPGSMRNKSISFFKPVDPGLPSTQGTRCHELAMFVVFDQYLASLCDSPAEYIKYPDVMRFLSSVPVSFDETVVLDASVGDKIITAKRKGNVWYVGGMTDWTARAVDVDFSFLDKGRKYNAFWLVDDESSNLYADRYKCVTGTVRNGDRQQVRMASGGGFVLMLAPAD
ncbi:MAG: glycoside hydrolase family 97 protein [Candidatus Cryptobacteroides sp.]